MSRDSRVRLRAARAPLFGFALSIVLVACASGSGASTVPSTPADSASPPSAPPTATTSAPAASQSFEGQTLNIMVDDFREAWDGTIWGPAFEEATGATIEWTYVPFAGLDAKYATLIASNDSSFDLITAIVTSAPAYRQILFAKMNGLVDQAILDDAGAIDKVGDDVYSVGVFDGAHLFYWNQEYYEQAGLDPAVAPASFDELFEQCDKLKVAFPDKYCFDWEMSDPNTTFSYWALLLNAAGGSMYSDDLTQVAFNGPAGQAALETLVRIFTYADPGGYTITSQVETGQRFAQGETMVNFNWDNADKQIMQDATKSTFVGKIGIGIIPGIGGNRSGSINGWEGYGINTYSENQALAAAFLEFVLSRDQQLEFEQTIGVGTSQKSYLADPAFNTSRAVAARSEQLQYPIGRYGAGFATQVNELFDVELNKMRTDGETAEQALANLTESVQQAIDQYAVR